ncbi:MAG: hypothetical protein JO304_06215 [Solirubrobacterales bacterium]|nr:hypothetical protein [Solirubrobacterales bacterium]
MALSALAAVGGLTACGGSSSTDTSGASQGTGQQQRVAALTQFAGCARAHGIPVPDPNSQGEIPGAEQLKQQYVNTPQGQATLKACGSYLRKAVLQLTPANTQSFRRAVLLSARCMRAHGIPVPDPGPDGQINLAAAASIDQASPQFQQAEQACAHLFPRSVATGG